MLGVPLRRGASGGSTYKLRDMHKEEWHMSHLVDQLQDVIAPYCWQTTVQAYQVDACSISTTPVKINADVHTKIQIKAL